MREVLNHRNNLSNNLDEKKRIAQKALEYKKIYKWVNKSTITIKR